MFNFLLLVNFKKIDYLKLTSSGLSKGYKLLLKI